MKYDEIYVNTLLIIESTEGKSSQHQQAALSLVLDKIVKEKSFL